MLIDFLKSCKSIFQSEIEDYNYVLQEITDNIDAFTAFMPAVIEDFWPIYIMETTKAQKYNKHFGNSIYVIPYGANDFWGVHGINSILRKWYEDDEINIGEDCGLKIEETILLKSLDIQIDRTIDIDDGKANTVYLKLSTNDGKLVHAVILIEKPHLVWENIIERFCISADLLIDSHKGLGGWFEDGYLYPKMKNTSIPHLLPHYYFKGKYISHEAPSGFEKIYVIPEAEGKHWCECAIYKTKWK